MNKQNLLGQPRGSVAEKILGTKFKNLNLLNISKLWQYDTTTCWNRYKNMVIHG